jgi:hypothetical protein
VAQAVLWALLASNPDDPAPAIEALKDPKADPGVQAMAAYALHFSSSPAAANALLWACQAVPMDSPADTPQGLLLWRALLSLPDNAVTRLPPALELTPAVLHGGGDLAPTTAPTGEPVLADPILLVRLYRLGALLPDPALALAEAPPNSLRTLAVLEGLPPDRYALRLPPFAPAAQQLAALAAAVNPELAQVTHLCRSGAPAIRDSACIIAAERLSLAQCSRLAALLLSDRDENARRSGAVIAGLTGVQPDLLARTAAADLDMLRDDPARWPTVQVLQMGLWMQGHMPPAQARQWDDQIATLAGYPAQVSAVPASTFMLGMLFKDRRAALDLLLNPRGQTPEDLVTLLDQWRWRRVLYHFLPADAPPFWPWADPELEQFQIDVLRAWYLLHRHEI